MNFLVLGFFEALHFFCFFFMHDWRWRDVLQNMVTSKVVDSYDVVQAVKHFASQRTADPKELQKEASSRCYGESTNPPLTYPPLQK